MELGQILLLGLSGLLLLALLGFFAWLVANTEYQMRMYYKELRETYPYRSEKDDA